MTSAHNKLEGGNFYHIFNRGINSCNLFDEEKDYLHYLTLYEKYVHPIANTYAWALMPNHFHILVYIKENIQYKWNAANKPNNKDFEEIKWETVPKPEPDSVTDLSAFKELPKELKELSKEPKEFSKEKKEPKEPSATKHFSHLFNAYSKYYNKKYKRHGALFERPFKRKLIDSEEYLRQIILYIHNNPVHHGFVTHPIEYAWSSYLTCLSEKETKLQRNKVLKLFNDKKNFKYCHQYYKPDSVPDLLAFE